MKIGLIGFGQFGQFFAKHLKKEAEIFATDKTDKSKEAKEIGVNFVDVEEAASQDIVLLAVPISELKNVLTEIKDSIKKDAIVIDVCSVKTIPSKLMKEILPETIEIIGTHPLFGPQSGRDGIRNLKIIICPVRASTKSLEGIKNIFRNLELEIIETTAEDHDISMATSHALMHFITLPLIKMDVKNQKIKISALDKALELIDIFKEDSPQLFRDMQNLNPFAGRLRKRFIKELQEIDSKLE